MRMEWRPPFEARTDSLLRPLVNPRQEVPSVDGPENVRGSALVGGDNAVRLSEDVPTGKTAMTSLPRQSQPQSEPSRSTASAYRRAAVRLILLSAVIIFTLLCLEVMTRIIYNRNGMHFSIEMWKYAKTMKRPSSNFAMGHEHTPRARVS